MAGECAEFHELKSVVGASLPVTLAPEIEQQSSACVRSWPSRDRQLSELVALKRPIKTRPMSDCSPAIKLALGTAATGHERMLTSVSFRAS